MVFLFSVIKLGDVLGNAVEANRLLPFTSFLWLLESCNINFKAADESRYGCLEKHN